MLDILVPFMTLRYSILIVYRLGEINAIKTLIHKDVTNLDEYIVVLRQRSEIKCSCGIHNLIANYSLMRLTVMGESLDFVSASVKVFCLMLRLT